MSAEEAHDLLRRQSNVSKQSFDAASLRAEDEGDGSASRSELRPPAKPVQQPDKTGDDAEVASSAETGSTKTTSPPRSSSSPSSLAEGRAEDTSSGDASTDPTQSSSEVPAAATAAPRESAFKGGFRWCGEGWVAPRYLFTPSLPP